MQVSMNKIAWFPLEDKRAEDYAIPRSLLKPGNAPSSSRLPENLTNLKWYCVLTISTQKEAFKTQRISADLVTRMLIWNETITIQNVTLGATEAAKTALKVIVMFQGQESGGSSYTFLWINRSIDFPCLGKY